MFCVECGTPLPDNAKFCPECGMRVASVSLAESVPAIEGVVKDPDASESSAQPTISLPIIDDPSVTSRMPKIDAASGEVLCETSDRQKNYVQDSAVPQAWTTPKVILLAVLIIIALILLFFATQLLLQNFSRITGGVADTVASVQEKGADPTEQPSSADEAAKTAQSDEAAVLDEIYSEMNIAYANVADYNAQIDDVVLDFNSWYLASNAAVRKDAAARCAKLKAKITAARDDFGKKLLSAGCAKGSLYYDEAQRIDALFGLLDGRVSSIDAAWAVDVGVEDPAAHEKEILAPIAEANVAGKSKYLTEFEKLYPDAKPKKLH